MVPDSSFLFLISEFGSKDYDRAKLTVGASVMFGESGTNFTSLFALLKAFR